MTPLFLCRFVQFPPQTSPSFNLEEILRQEGVLLHFTHFLVCSTTLNSRLALRRLVDLAGSTTIDNEFTDDFKDVNGASLAR